MLTYAELITITLFILGTMSSIIGFYIKGLYGRVEALEQDMTNHRVEDAKEFVRKTDLQILKEDIKEIIAPLNSKMENIETHLRNGSKTSH